jgi:hypothetical protein
MAKLWLTFSTRNVTDQQTSLSLFKGNFNPLEAQHGHDPFF